MTATAFTAIPTLPLPTITTNNSLITTKTASQEAVFICRNPVICHKHIHRVPKIANTVGNNKEVVIIDAPILQNGAGRDAQREKLVTQEAPPATSTPQASRKGLSTEGAYTVKLTNLSIAILIALGTVACGGSDNNSGNNNPPADPPAPQPKPETPPADNSQKDSKIVDPTETHVVDGRDLSKDSTVGGLQYIRRESSDYDRVYNPDKMASATPLLGVSLNEQNPKLTNIVLARRDLEREENKGVRAQFAGSEENEPLTHAGKEREQPSLQIENFKNVDILAGAFKQVGSAVFADPSNRLDPVTHNIDTHIQNNTDKSGEFTRERVTHVYTPRYEYRQPFVDYPNAANSADNRKEADGDKTIATKAPAPPGFPDINALESALYGSNGSWSTEDANDNSRHPVNTGTDKDRSFGSFSNERDRYGNFPSGKDDSPTDPANIADAKAWRNKGTRTANGTAVPQTRSPDREGNHYYSDAKTDNVVDWQGDDANLPAYKGTITRAQAITRTGANTASYTPSPDSTYNYQQSWPNGAYPQYPKKLFAYPNVAYDEPGNNALNGGSADGDPKNHEHIYLEREEFTAIRQLEPIRPLVNPIANEWDWTLYQVWDASVKYHKLVKEERERIIGKNPDGTPKKEKYEVVVHDKDHTANIGDSDNDAKPVQTIQAKLANLSLVDPQCSGKLVTCTKLGESYSLKSANWHTPDNKGGGIRGEFRGPAYVGYHEDLATIRFADDRIWKSGTPGYKQEYEKKYGANLIWWSTQDSAFENHATSNGWNPRARRVDINTKASNGGNDAEGLEELIWAKDSGNGNEARDRDVEIQPTGDITNGLIRIGYTARTGKMPTLGQELKWEDGRWKDHHNTTSRIFGHYHLAYADQDDRKVKSMSMNSYSGARSFVAKVKDVLPQATAQGYRADLDSAPVEYSIGAQPITLHKVQYGRVTTQLDLAAGEGPFGDGFLRAPFAKKNTDDSVDNYFFRGIDATSVADMPKEGSATYNGHALMYGINNDFHGVTQDVSLNGGYKNLPNAFDGLNGRGQAQIALGNFVEANVDFATRKVKGDVYNAWLTDLSKSTVVHDKLVAFEGNIIGNTVLGKADRSYIHGNDEAEFRAAFFGKEAEEMGGSFNSVKPDDKYGSAYENGDWGGVFGAVKSASNTFQGDDGKGVYGNSNVVPANNYNE